MSPPKRVLVVDVGGTHVKFSVSPRGKVTKIESGREMSASDMAEQVAALVPRSSYDAVSIGYPGLVLHGKIVAEPHSLGSGWIHYNFEKVFGAPVRVINDAAMQAIGSYTGGRMLFLGFGTGLGTTLVLDGVVEPMELGHVPYKRGHSYEEYVGERGLKRLGLKKWRKTVKEVVEQLSRVLEVDYVVVGGGNAKKLKVLPPNGRLGDNRHAFAGGVKIWRYPADSLVIGPQRKSRRRVDKPR